MAARSASGQSRVSRLRHSPGSITAETRQGRKGFRATWLPSNSSARFATKREATAFIKAARAYRVREMSSHDQDNL